MNVDNVKQALATVIDDLLGSKDIAALKPSASEEILEGISRLLHGHEADALQHAKDVAAANAVAAKCNPSAPAVEPVATLAASPTSAPAAPAIPSSPPAPPPTPSQTPASPVPETPAVASPS